MILNSSPFWHFILFDLVPIMKPMWRKYLSSPLHICDFCWCSCGVYFCSETRSQPHSQSHMCIVLLRVPLWVEAHRNWSCYFVPIQWTVFSTPLLQFNCHSMRPLLRQLLFTIRFSFLPLLYYVLFITKNTPKGFFSSSATFIADKVTDYMNELTGILTYIHIHTYITYYTYISVNIITHTCKLVHNSTFI